MRWFFLLMVRVYTHTHTHTYTRLIIITCMELMRSHQELAAANICGCSIIKIHKLLPRNSLNRTIQKFLSNNGNLDDAASADIWLLFIPLLNFKYTCSTGSAHDRLFRWLTPNSKIYEGALYYFLFRNFLILLYRHN